MEKDFKKIFDEYIKTNREVLKRDKEVRELYEAIKNGSVKYARVTRTEDSSRDLSWVNVLEDAIPHIQTIIDNPKSYIKSVHYIVPAELAKKTGPESITHLSTHSQFVKKIEDDGTIVPSKILVSEGEIDYQTYENRFIMTLIKRLHMYVERRYVFLKKFAALRNSDILYLDNEFRFGETNITTTTTVKISQPTETSEEMQKEMNSSLSKLEFIRKYTTYFVNSEFMKEQMKGAAKVSSPIMQTNVIRKNPHYHAAFNLWQFLNKEEHASMDFLVNEDIKQLSEEEEERINFINYLNCIDVMIGKNLSSMRLTKKNYSTQVLKSIDDKLFLNEKFMPFELVRADDKYFDSLEKPLRAKLKGKSKKVQDKVFKKSKREIAKIEKQRKAAAALKARKRKEAARLAKQEEKARIAEAARIAKQKEIDAKQARIDRLNELARLRKEIREQAINDKKKAPIELVTPVTLKIEKAKPTKGSKSKKSEFKKVHIKKTESFLKEKKYSGEEEL